MKINNALLNEYEQKKLLNYSEIELSNENVVAYSEIKDSNIKGVLKASFYKDGKLTQMFSKEPAHICVISATGMGKTYGYVMPTIDSMSLLPYKPSMILSDPKGELYSRLSNKLRERGYRVIKIDFRDCMSSECWNPLTPIYRKYHRVFDVYNEVELEDTEKGPRNKFRGVIYNKQKELDEIIDRIVSIQMEEVANDIDNLASMFISTDKSTDPYWEDSARDVLKAFLWAMLEDSRPSDDEDRKYNLITEETFSFSNILNILKTFKDSDDRCYNDGGYFMDRKESSRALDLANHNFIQNAPHTRKCIMSTFNAKMSIFRESATRLITSCNSFNMDDLVDDSTVVFINYRDELKTHYQIISLFVQQAYTRLIDKANENISGKLDKPFYFILDEFGNFPRLIDFETTISACRGRSIYFMLVIQSYAQLNNVYGPDVAEIIRDNLNIHVFMGSNNPNTLEEFSRECGEYTRISPLSALNGSRSDIEHYEKETIPLMTKSKLSCFNPGECIITEANCGYVLFSRIERYYMCKEYEGELADGKDYKCPVNLYDKKYIYTLKKRAKKKFDFDF